MPRLEIFTGTERRRRWLDADKLAVLEEASVPGISAASVARRHDLLPQQIYRWRRQFGWGRHGDGMRAGVPAPAASVFFLPLELVAPGRGAGSARASTAIPTPVRSRQDHHAEPLAEVLLANGRCLRVCPTIDEASLARLIRIAEGA